MRSYLYIILTLILAALLQQLLPVWPLFGGMKPPILAMTAFYFALRRPPADVWTAVFSAALLQDGLDLGPPGPALIAFPVIGMLALRIRSEIFSDGIVTQLFFGAALGLFTGIITLTVYCVTGQRTVSFTLGLLRLFNSAVLGMITLPPVSIALRKFEAVLPKRRDFGWQ
jgi:rod shape-determining protein MreD